MTVFRALVSAAALVCVGTTTAFGAPVIFFGENLAAGGSSVSGDPVTARTQFLSNLDSSVKSEGFESFANNQNAPLDLVFTGSSGNLGAKLTGSGTVFNTPASGRYNTTAGGANLWEVDANSFTVDFGATLISAFGFYGTDIGDFNGSVSLILTDKDNVVSTINLGSTPNAADGSLLFWGFVDVSNQYKKITFSTTGAFEDNFGFDDMVVGDLRQIVNPIPEPSSLALAGLALAGLAASRRRKA